MIALLIGVELYSPWRDVIIFNPIPKNAHMTISLKSLISTFSHFKKNDINQKRTAAPKTLQYNNAFGYNTSGMSSLAIVWLNPNIEVASNAAKRPRILLSIKFIEFSKDNLYFCFGAIMLYINF